MELYTDVKCTKCKSINGYFMDRNSLEKKKEDFMCKYCKEVFKLEVFFMTFAISTMEGEVSVLEVRSN